MSSLNATQADGYYIPPSYLESGAYKKQSISQFAGSKGHNQYLTRSVVRFELPYDGFCLACQAHIGKGTRFNAHKAHIDDYFTTKIWEFSMKCRACAKQPFKIRTNPKERCFNYVSGIKKKVEEFDTIDAGTHGVIDTDYGNSIHVSEKVGISAIGVDDEDPLSKLEKQVTGERKAMTERDAMDFLLKHNATNMYDDAASNSRLRSKYRMSRNAKKRRLGDAQRAGLGMGIELSDPLPEDSNAVSAAFDNPFIRDKRSREKEKKSFASIRRSSIFVSSNDIVTPKKFRAKSIKQKALLSPEVSTKSTAQEFHGRSLNQDDKVVLNKRQKVNVHQLSKKKVDANADGKGPTPDVLEFGIHEREEIDTNGESTGSSLLALDIYHSDSE